MATEVENWPSNYVKLMGPVLMERILKHTKKFIDKENIIYDHIHTVNSKNTPFELIGNKEIIYTCDALIIVTGASDRYLNLSFEKNLKVGGFQLVLPVIFFLS